MATPIGHGLAGYGVSLLLGRRGEPRPLLPALVAVAASLAPDLDFLPGLLRGSPALYHHGISHSLGFALAAGLLAALLLPLPGWRRRTVFWLVFLAYSSHLLLDLVGPDARPPLGIPLFWPLSPDYHLSPLTLLLGVRHSGVTAAPTAEWIAAILHWYNLVAVALELLLVGSLVLAASRLRGREPAPSASLPSDG